MNTKAWYFSRTLWVAVIQGILGIIVALGTQVPVVGWLMVIKSILDVALRFLTSTPVAL